MHKKVQKSHVTPQAIYSYYELTQDIYVLYTNKSKKIICYITSHIYTHIL